MVFTNETKELLLEYFKHIKSKEDENDAYKESIKNNNKDIKESKKAIVDFFEANGEEIDASTIGKCYKEWIATLEGTSDLAIVVEVTDSLVERNNGDN